MGEHVSRRRLIQGAAATAVAGMIVGFDPASRSWATEISRGTIPVPRLDGSLTTDPAARQEAADDYGHIVHRLPYAVLRPGSVDDVVTMIRFAKRWRLKVAMRGQGHVCFGQAQVRAGIVIDSRTLASVHAIGGGAAVVDP